MLFHRLLFCVVCSSVVNSVECDAEGIKGPRNKKNQQWKQRTGNEIHTLMASERT